MGQPTMEDVAAEAGVSRALVSLVMRDSPKVGDARRELVLEAAAKLGYRPNVLARNLASRRTMTLGVVVNDLHNPFFAEVVDGIQKTAEERGYSVLLATGGKTRAGDLGAIESFLRFRVDGVVLAGPRLAATKILSAALECPIVLLGRTIRSRKVDTVNNDEVIGAGLAVRHLHELGHRSIAHIDGGTGAGAASRRAGYEAAMTELGLEREILVAQGDFTETSGVDGARTLLAGRRRPTAIFAANDLTAAGALNSIEDLGLAVPNDISLVGYDNSGVSALAQMSLTTINQPRREMGNISVELMVDRLTNDRTDAIHHVVTPSLVTRTSTATL